MPSIAIHETFVAVTGATAAGVLTVAATTGLYPGANAWVAKDDGSLSARVKILSFPSSTTVLVRRYPSDTEGRPDNATFVPAGYGVGNMSAFNGAATHICQEAQNVPIDPAFSVRSFA